MIFIWFSLFVFLSFIELISVAFVSIWFAFGALATSIFSIFVSDPLVQLYLFCFVSFVSLVFTRPFVKKFSVNKIEATNLDRIIGLTGIVTEDIELNKVGEVKVDGKKWAAISKENIQKDEMVKIISINSVKLEVEKLKEE